jgi:hypothetical protein
LICCTRLRERHKVAPAADAEADIECERFAENAKEYGHRAQRRQRNIDGCEKGKQTGQSLHREWINSQPQLKARDVRRRDKQ